MQKRHSINLGAIICVSIATYCLYLLLLDSILPLSIGSVIMHISHWPEHSHIVAIGLVPVYLSLMVFGTNLAAFYLGSFIHRKISRLFSRRVNYSTKCKNDAIHVVRKNPFEVNTKVS